MMALIVDDEARVRKAVRLLVDWEAHGITEIAEAAGGYEAIEMMERQKPAIVIMDMMMPEGNGVDVMEAVQRFAGEMKFIVVSGRNDFDFVRAAVRHGGVDYLLKPIEPESINAAVAKAAAQWREERREREERDKRNRQLNEMKPVYGEKLLGSLLDDSAHPGPVVRRLEEEGVLPANLPEVRLALLQVDPGDKQLHDRFGRDEDLLLFALVNVCGEFMTRQGRGVAFRRWGAAGEVAMLYWGEPERLTDLLHEINEGLFMTFERKMHIGISEAGPFPESLPRLREEAAEALSRRNLLAGSEFVHLHAESGSSAIPDAGWQEQWRIAACSGDPELISRVSDMWLDAAVQGGAVTPVMLETYQTEAEGACQRLLREEGVQESLGEAGAAAASTEGERPDPHAAHFQLHQWRDWSRRLLEHTSALIVQRQSKEKARMGDIAAYIQAHYREELSLQDIAKRFFVSREYVSRKFKQELGVNISEYIVSVRLRKAKELLVNPRLTIARVAEMVGFHDEKYFSKVFKKQEGQTPKAYRTKLGH